MSLSWKDEQSFSPKTSFDISGKDLRRETLPDQEAAPTKEATQETAHIHTTAPSCSTSYVNTKPLGMAWYKFLIYFGLIAGAIINIIYGLNYISGEIYFVLTNGEVSGQQVYYYYGTTLQFVDILYGVFLIAFAILAFVVRHKLAKYKPDALQFVKFFYFLSACVPFLYAILVSAITEQSLSTQAVTSALVGLVFLSLNIRYFKKRAHLFVDKTISSQPPVQVISHTQQAQKSDSLPVSNVSAAPEQLTTMFCRKCGTKLFKDSVFCHVCGTKSVSNE